MQITSNMHMLTLPIRLLQLPEICLDVMPTPQPCFGNMVMVQQPYCFRSIITAVKLDEGSFLLTHPRNGSFLMDLHLLDIFCSCLLHLLYEPFSRILHLL